MTAKKNTTKAITTRRPADLSRFDKRVAAVTEVKREDLAVPENVQSIVAVAADINGRVKEYGEVEKRLKTRVKDMFSDEMERGAKVTLYNYEQGKKVTVSTSGSGVDIDEDALLKAMYAHFGEEEGDTSGKAWETWVSISEPQPRKMNLDKLEALALSDPAMMELSRSVSTYKKGNVVYKVMDLKKSEKTAYEAGKPCEAMVIEAGK